MVVFLQIRVEVQKWVIYVIQINFNLFIQARLPITLRKTPHICTYDYTGARKAEA